jgi:hypothetical protein
MIPKMCASDFLPGGSVHESRNPGSMICRELPDERETTAVPGRRRRRPKHLDAGPLAADVASFGLHLAAGNKAAKTIRIYTEAPLCRRSRY